jgi:type II secretory ATPase GspE/PulE/Tfp pilus assembly ATPase PilB-like protein
MKTLYKSALEEVLSGATTLEELLRVVDVRTE